VSLPFPPLSEPDRRALSTFTAAVLHVRRRDGGDSVRLFLSLLDRDELERLTVRLIYCLNTMGEASDEDLRAHLLALEAAG
jgi:streptomycin 6-kinase